jgi:hypothetical protein
MVVVAGKRAKVLVGCELECRRREKTELERGSRRRRSADEKTGNVCSHVFKVVVMVVVCR